MYRLIKMNDRWYATEIDSDVENDIDNIQAFLENGEVVVLADDIEWAAETIGIKPEDIELVE